MPKFFPDPWRRADVSHQRAGHAVHLVSGVAPILLWKEMLIELSVRCGQPGTMEDLAYFLSKPGLMRRVPKLYLMVRQEMRMEEITADDLVGALLLYEYSVFGVGTRAFATNDRSGRGTMLALPHQRVELAAEAARLLLDRGAHVVMLTFRAAAGSASANQDGLMQRSSKKSSGAMWALRSRAACGYLPLEATYEGTLAQFGPKTRRNMRYYRRRAESLLGCTFDPQVTIELKEFLGFNEECMFPASAQVARWRLKTQTKLAEPILMGMKDANGRWLSILAARRCKDTTEVLWQMNREGLPEHSLGIVMRSYCIEHEIGRGARRLQFEGGTSHSIQHAFVKEDLIDLVLISKSSRGLVKRVARKLVPPDNLLAEMLMRQDLAWRPC